MVAALLAVAVYLTALDNPFVHDDFRLIVENPSILNLSDWRAIVAFDVTRPLVNLSYAFDTRVWGMSPFGYHVTNLLLHAINVVLLFWIAYLASEDRKRQPSQAGRVGVSSSGTAFLTAALFAVHPMLTQAVGYVTGRSEVLYSTFFFLAFLAGRRWLLEGGRRWWIATVVLWAAAMLAKETAAMLSFVLLGYDWLLLDTTHAERRRRFLRLGLPLLIVTFLAGAGRIAILQIVEYPETGADWRLAPIAVNAFWRYLILMIAPRGQAIFHAVPMLGPLDLRALGGVAGLVGFAGVVWVLRPYHGILSFGLLWFLLLLVPSSLLFILGRGEALAEHRAYLSAAGLFLAGGAAFGSLWSRTRWRTLLAGATAMLIVLLSMQTLLRNAIWHDPVALSREAVNRSPGHWIPRLLVAEALRQGGRCGEAVPEYQASIALRPQDDIPYAKLTECLIRLRRFDEAGQTLDRLKQLSPSSQEAAMGLGLLALLQDRPEVSRALFEQAVGRNPSSPRAGAMLAFLEGRLPTEECQRICDELRSIAGGPIALRTCASGGVSDPSAPSRH